MFCGTVAGVARGFTILLALLCLLGAAGAARAQDAGTPGRRVALVIGNSTYGVPQLFLPNPKNDAQDVGAALKALGFDVVALNDLKLAAFDEAVRTFRDKAAGAEIALFFYAGHAVQSDNVNYFIPTDANITQGLELKRLAVSVRDVQDAMSGTQGVQVMILDACRDNPFSMMKAPTRGVEAALTRGLQPVQLEGSGDAIVLYSTLANAVASDGAPGARNSPFSRVLIDMLKRPGEHELQSVLLDVAAKVKSQSGGRQSPEFSSHISGRYALDLVNDDLQWQAIRHSLDPAVFRAFAARFPLSTRRRDAERYATLLEAQEDDRRREAEAQARHEAEARRAREDAEREAKACREGGQRLDLMRAGADQGGLERLARENGCPALQASIDAALQSVMARKRAEACDRLEAERGDYADGGNAAGLAAIQQEAAACPGLSDRIAQSLAAIESAAQARREAEEQQRLAAQRQREADDRQRAALRQQEICTDEGSRLDALVHGPGPHRSEDAAALAGAAQCEAVRSQALALADDLGRQEAQAAHDARQKLVCATESRTLEGAITGGPRVAIEALGRAHACETLDVPAALARYDDLLSKRREQAVCDDEGGRLKTLTDGRGPRRTDDIATLGATAQCGPVRAQAAALAADLRRQEAQAAHDAKQRLACTTEGQTLQGAVLGGPRSVLEALARAHECETLDVAAALARFDDLVEKRRQEAMKACAAVDVAGLGRRGDAKGLADLLAQCPSRHDDVAAATEALAQRQRLAETCRQDADQLQRLVAARQKTAVEDLGRQAACPTLDVPGALAAIAAAACADGRVALGALSDRDEAGLRGYAGNPDLCSEVRTAAQARLDRIETARRDDAACDQAVADASGRGDAAGLQSLLAGDTCVRRRETIARLADALARKAEQARLAKADCDRSIAAVGRAQDADEAALNRLLTDTALCPAARDAATTRLAGIAAARRDDAACDRALAEASGRGDIEALQGLSARAVCLRRGQQIAQAIEEARGKAEQVRLAAAACDAGVAAVRRLDPADDGALHRLADDLSLCPAARDAAATRLAEAAVARADADSACEAAVETAALGGDVERIAALDADPLCTRRRSAVAAALTAAQRTRTRAAQQRLADLGCYAAAPNGSLDAATLRAVALYRKAKGEEGAPPTAFTADFVQELAAQTSKVCVEEAALTPKDTSPAPSAAPEAGKPMVPEPKGVSPAEGPNSGDRKAAPEAPRPHPRPRVTVAPPPKVKPRPRQLAEPIQRPRPAPVPREPPPPPVTTQSAEPKGHIFY